MQMSYAPSCLATYVPRPCLTPDTHPHITDSPGSQPYLPCHENQPYLDGPWTEIFQTCTNDAQYYNL